MNGAAPLAAHCVLRLGVVVHTTKEHDPSPGGQNRVTRC